MGAFHVRLLTLLTLAMALLAGGAQAQPQPLPTGGVSIVPQLVAETDTPVPGTSLDIAIAMRPKPGWHGYWRNPGDAGTEPEIAWRLPPGMTAEPLAYPVPSRLTIAGLMNYVYEEDYALLSRLRIPAEMAPGTVLPIRATLDYLACTDRICVPQRADVALDLTVGEEIAAPERLEQFDAWRRALPRPLGSEARFEVEGGALRLAVPIPGSLRIVAPYFFPGTREALSYSAPQAFARRGDWLIAEMVADEGAASLDRLEGVLKIGEDQGLAVTARRGDVPAGGTALSPAGGQQGGIVLLLTALLGALVGGVLLNVMPCVFPILSLKALSLARAGAAESAARREALAYATGVVLVCLALGGLLLALRAGGSAVGWAFQLQDPRVILLLLLLVFAIALNLAGLFELPALTGGGRLASGGGASGAFWTGALAAFVATPCTGPFMGAALGAALVIPAPAALAVFAGLGLGLALPFLLLGFVPALRRRLPRPGPWMARFRRWMSLPMFVTAAALVWILARQTGGDGVVLGLGAALVLAAALWLVGRLQGRGPALLPLLPAAAAGLAAVMLLPSAEAPAMASQSLPGAERFSAERLAALRIEGRPVFVYFTADWCVTCKVNEQTVLARGDIADHFAERDVAVLVGDWTGGDPAISRFLESQGRSGVPLYLYYAPGKEAQVLPQLLTVAAVTQAVG